MKFKANNLLNNKMVKDHLGKSYQSVKEMCSAYNISYAVFLDEEVSVGL
jgi:hypothetical protein